MRLPRWTHRLYAFVAGYFWLPCPLCGVEMGGHEWDGSSIPTGTPGVGKGICRSCSAAMQPADNAQAGEQS